GISLWVLLRLPRGLVVCRPWPAGPAAVYPGEVDDDRPWRSSLEEALARGPDSRAARPTFEAPPLVPTRAPTAPTPPAPPAGRRRGRWSLVAALVVVALAAGGAAGWVVADRRVGRDAPDVAGGG